MSEIEGFLEGFLSRWAIVIEKMPPSWNAVGEVAGTVSIIVMAVIVMVSGFGTFATLYGNWVYKDERECKSEKENE